MLTAIKNHYKIGENISKKKKKTFTESIIFYKFPEFMRININNFVSVCTLSKIKTHTTILASLW